MRLEAVLACVAEISLAAYQGIGGVGGTPSGHAQQACGELLGRLPQEPIRNVLLALVRNRGGAAGATSKASRTEKHLLISRKAA